MEVFSGFDWDEGNREKRQRHGISIADIEGLFTGQFMIRPEVAHSQTETRFLAIGQSPATQYILVAFTIRELNGYRTLRPISA